MPPRPQSVHVPLEDLLKDVRYSLRPLAASRQITIATRMATPLPRVNSSGATITDMATCLLTELIKFTPTRRTVLLSARSVRRGAGWGRGRWVEVALHSRKARMGSRELRRVLTCLGPMRLAEVVTDFYRGELRLTLLCRVNRLPGAWFVVRRGTRDVPVFSMVLRATSRLA